MANKCTKKYEISDSRNSANFCKIPSVKSVLFWQEGEVKALLEKVKIEIEEADIEMEKDKRKMEEGEIEIKKGDIEVEEVKIETYIEKEVQYISEKEDCFKREKSQRKEI